MKKPSKHKGNVRIAAAAPALRVDKRVEESKSRKATPPQDVMPKDDAYDRNFTRKGTPRLSASSGSGAMGQRR